MILDQLLITGKRRKMLLLIYHIIMKKDQMNLFLVMYMVENYMGLLHKK